jgi:hypothetical protein
VADRTGREQKWQQTESVADKTGSRTKMVGDRTGSEKELLVDRTGRGKRDRTEQ